MAFVPRLTAPTNFDTWYNEKRRNPSGCLTDDACGTLTYWQRSYSGDPNSDIPDNPPHTGNCTWYAYGRSGEIAGKNIYNEFTGTEGDANKWATNAKWNGKQCAQTSGTINYQLGDILIYKNSSDTAGHVEIVEEINGNTLTISYSGYSSYTPRSEYSTWFNTRKRSKMNWGDAAAISSEPDSAYIRNNGAHYYLSETLCGIIHNPYVSSEVIITPDGRNTSVDQVQILVEGLNVRDEASTSSAVTGIAQQYGYYNVISSTTAEGMTWYHLGPNKWVADTGTSLTYIPASTAMTYDIAIINTTPLLGSTTGAGTYDEGDSAIIVATSTDIGVFEHWLENSSIFSTEDNEEFAVTEDRTFTVKFAFKSVDRDTTVNQIHVFDNISTLNVRDGAGTGYNAIGYAKAGGYYRCYATVSDGTYTWYKIHEGPDYWIASNAAGSWCEFLAKDPGYMSKLRLGSVEVKNVAVGSTVIKKVALGSTILYTKGS